MYLYLIITPINNVFDFIECGTVRVTVSLLVLTPTLLYSRS